jgi:hypothetical protein
MALAKNIVLQDNFGDDKQFSNAYIKVDFLSGSKTDMRVAIGVYKEKDGKKINSQQATFIPNLSGSNFIAQAYEHLKTMPEFAGAVDC